jgi:hypothetical protein
MLADPNSKHATLYLETMLAGCRPPPELLLPFLRFPYASHPRALDKSGHGHPSLSLGERPIDGRTSDTERLGDGRRSNALLLERPNP